MIVHYEKEWPEFGLWIDFIVTYDSGYVVRELKLHEVTLRGIVYLVEGVFWERLIVNLKNDMLDPKHEIHELIQMNEQVGEALRGI